MNNKDLEQFIPMLIDTMQNPIKVPDCVHKLASTTFVQAVEAPTLSIMVPLLVRGLRHDNTTAIKRKASVIIENMAKLVSGLLRGAAPTLVVDELCRPSSSRTPDPVFLHRACCAAAAAQVDNPLDAAPFLPQLLPGLEKVSNEVADPECRAVAARAAKELVRVANEGKTGVCACLLAGAVGCADGVLGGQQQLSSAASSCTTPSDACSATPQPKVCTGAVALCRRLHDVPRPCAQHLPACRSLLPAAVPPKKADPTAVAAALKELIAARAPKVAGDEVFAPTLAYVAGLCAALQDTKNFEFDEWNGVASTPFLASFMPEAEAEAVTRAYLVSAQQGPAAGSSSSSG